MESVIIVDRALVADTWTLLREANPVPAHGDIIVPLALWLTQRGALGRRSGRTGVWLAPSDDPAALAADCERLPLIAIDFPQFTDGRGYSIARLLRERHGFAGELRAIGDIGRDQLFYLARVGFNAFVLKPGQDTAAARMAFADFSDAYQSSVAEPRPPYRRRLEGALA
ncbi:MAG: DUF934 domain-containing protein [Burkholderiales bacterium]|nr:DUF934 domain-containing protein [Burkholderiales bacterium]